MRAATFVCCLAGALLVAACAVAGEATASDIVEGKPALIVMDTQNLFLPMMDPSEVESAKIRINAAITLFRQQGLPVIRVYHSSEKYGPPKESEGFQFPDDIAVEESDPAVVKGFPSAFRETELKQVLDGLGCDTVFLVGLSATGCVMATYWDADSLGLDVFMVRGALMSDKHSLTEAVEEMTGAVGFPALRYMLAHAPR
jgi:nicotinamidase-related amidase